MSRVMESAAHAAAPVPAARQFLTFQLAGEMYAVGILNIKEIIECGALTSVPMMPGFIRGVINLRGSVVPVVDLDARFGRAPSKIGKRSCIVIIEAEAEGEFQDVGVLVDSVSEVLDIADADIEPAPTFGSGIRSDFVSGMGKVSGRFVILLELSRVLAVEELATLARDPDTAAH